MAGFIARQPNGLLCRHSNVTDCITDYNMTEEDYIAMCMENAKAEACAVIKNNVLPFSEIESSFVDNNMTQERFWQILMEMQQPKECSCWKKIF